MLNAESRNEMKGNTGDLQFSIQQSSFSNSSARFILPDDAPYLANLSAMWAVEPKLARAESVRAALALVERGEAPLGVVYATDAAVSSKVKVVGLFPDSMHDVIVYPFALVAGHESAASHAFLDYLRSNDAKTIWTKYGFRLN